MKRLLLPSLALLLVMSSVGHVLAAAFCPRVLGHECCFAKTSGHTHNSRSTHEDMPVHDMPVDAMPMHHAGMHSMPVDDVAIDATPTSDSLSSTVISDEAPGNRFDQPVESCAHCMSHSSVPNAPVSFVSAPDQSKKDFGSVTSPVSSFLVRPAMTPAQIGLPREHAPPGMSTPRHILINVFLI
jgi:hypothetical protein